MITFKETKSLKEYDSVSLAAMLRAYFIENYPAATVERLNDAIQVASYLHRNDVRRGARGKSIKPPYIEHPLRVAVRLYTYFGVTDPDIIIAAILHDTVEDHPFDFIDFEGVLSTSNEQSARERALGFIAKKFGFGVATLVEAVSNPIIVGEPTKAEKIAEYQQHVTAVVNFRPGALIIKLSDFVDNAGSLHHHYNLGDSKVIYFIDRYEALIPVYRNAIEWHEESGIFDALRSLQRLETIAKQFEKFRVAAGESDQEALEVDKVLRTL